MASTTPYTLPASRVYVDTEAAALYAENAGTEVVMVQKLNTTALKAMDAWIKHVWLGGSGAVEVLPGEGRAYVNHKRLIPQLKIEEQITSAGLPVDGDFEGVVTIQYKVTNPGVLPIADHIALVRFIQDHSQQTPVTELVWTIKLTLAAEGNSVFPSGAAVIPFLSAAVTGALAQLAETVDESNAPAKL